MGVVLFGGEAAASPAPLTLATAKHMGAEQLAARLLGEAGATQGYVEADVHGNGGLMIGMPGLNYILLYQRPKSAGFAGLCEVDAVKVDFETSKYNTRGDPPHRAIGFDKFVRFAILKPHADRAEDTDWRKEDRDCAKLAPVAGRTDPVFFAVRNDSPVLAYFAMRALVKAQASAVALAAQVTCQSDDPTLAGCENPAALLRSIPIQRIHQIASDRCIGGGAACVTVTWPRQVDGNESHEIEIAIHTNASQIDPPSDFDVTAVAMSGDVTIDD